VGFLSNGSKHPSFYYRYHVADQSQALIYSYGARDGFREHHGSIKRSTHAVYFFGTPHQGSEGTSIATELLNIGKLFINTNKNKLTILTRDSEQLQLINEEFLPLRKHLETKYFFELRKTKLPGGSSMIVRNSKMCPFGYIH
jgi:hypothetical protein